jgi:hypothetical protein
MLSYLIQFFTGFHSCVGGCNGCLNLDNIFNKGLTKAVSKIEQFYTANNLGQDIISRADLWAIAAVMAVETGYLNDHNK